MKKTLQHELKVNNGNASTNSTTNLPPSTAILAFNDNEKLIGDMNAQPTVVMDDVNFKYLKHVILKFLTSREVRSRTEFALIPGQRINLNPKFFPRYLIVPQVEARHLIRAIGTLLHLSHEEEQLLHDTLNFKVSWFGTRPTEISSKNRHQKLFTKSSQPSS